MSSLKQLTVASFPPVSLGDGGCWTIMNSTSKYSASMNGSTLRHEWAFVSLWCALKQASKIQVNSPMRLRLKIRHGDMWTWPRYEPVPQIPYRRIVCSGTAEKTSQRLKNSLFISCRSLHVLSLAVPTSPFSGNRTSIDWTFTNDLITMLAQTTCFPSPNYNLLKSGHSSADTLFIKKISTTTLACYNAK